METHGLNSDNETLQEYNEEISENNHSPVNKPRLHTSTQQLCYDKYCSRETGMNNGERAHAHIRHGVAEHTNQFLEQFRQGLDDKNPNPTFDERTMTSHPMFQRFRKDYAKQYANDRDYRNHSRWNW